MTDFRFICVRFILFILDLKILSVTERHSYVKRVKLKSISEKQYSQTCTAEALFN